MATVIIRPNDITSSTGFDVSGATLLSNISDDDDGTRAVQNNTECSITGIAFANSTSYSGATINSVTLSVFGSAGGRGSGPVITCVLKNGNSTLQTSEFEYEEAGILSGAAYSTSLTPTIVDNLSVHISADSTGVAIYEVYITVNYNAAPTGYGNAVIGVAATSIVSFNGIATANIANVIGVS